MRIKIKSIETPKFSIALFEEESGRDYTVETLRPGETTVIKKSAFVDLKHALDHFDSAFHMREGH